MSQMIVPEYDRQAFLDAVERLEPRVRQLYLTFLERLASLEPAESTHLHDYIDSLFQRKSDPTLRLIAIISECDLMLDQRGKTFDEP